MMNRAEMDRLIELEFRQLSRRYVGRPGYASRRLTPIEMRMFLRIAPSRLHLQPSEAQSDTDGRQRPSHGSPVGGL